MRFGLALPCTLENKENARPYVIREDTDGDSGDGQVLYRDDYDDEKSEPLSILLNFLTRELSGDRLLKTSTDSRSLLPILFIGRTLVGRQFVWHVQTLKKLLIIYIIIYNINHKFRLFGVRAVTLIRNF